MKAVFSIVEGDGDQLAVPELLRKALSELNAYDIELVTPMKVGDIKGILRGRRFEKAVRYAQLQHPDSLTLVSCDLDDGCVLENTKAVQQRVLDIFPELLNPVAVVLFKREYESMFLANIADVREELPHRMVETHAVEEIEICARDAKGVMTNLMRDTTYKEIRDQVRFTSCVKVPQWRMKYRPLDHLVRVLEWRLEWRGGALLYGDLTPH